MVAKSLDDTLITAINRYTILRRELEYNSHGYARHKVLWEDMFSVEKEIQERIKKGEKINKHLFDIDYLRKVQSYIFRYSFFHFPLTEITIENDLSCRYSTFDIIPLVREFMKMVDMTRSQTIVSTRQEKFYQQGTSKGAVTILENSLSSLSLTMCIRVEGFKTFDEKKREWSSDLGRTNSDGLVYIDPAVFTTLYHKTKLDEFCRSMNNSQGQFWIGDPKFIEKLFLRDPPKWNYCLYIGDSSAKPRLSWKPSGELEEPPYIMNSFKYN